MSVIAVSTCVPLLVDLQYVCIMEVCVSHKVLQVYVCVCMCMSPVFVYAHNGRTERTLAACIYI